MPHCGKSIQHACRLLCLALRFVVTQQVSAASNGHNKLSLNGIASYHMLGSEYYLASLYLQSPSTDANDILNAPGLKRMKLVITKEKWRSRHFAEAWLSAININNSKGVQQAMGEDIFAFTQIAKGALYEGDVVLIDYTPGKGTHVYINNTLVLKVKNREYFSVLLRAWIGLRPPSSDFKQHILDSKTNDKASESVSRMGLTVPANKAARNTEVETWGIAAAAAVSAAEINAAKKKSADSAKRAERNRKAKKAEAAKRTEQKRKADAARRAENKRKADIANQAEAKRQAEAAKLASDKRKAAEAKLEEEDKLAEEKRQNAESKKRNNPLRNRIREQMRKNVHKAYSQNITRIAQEKVIYPTKSLNAVHQGSVSIIITLGRNGKLLKMEMTEKTAHIALNKAAEKAAKSASYPPLPTQLNDSEEFLGKLNFSLN